MGRIATTLYITCIDFFVWDVNTAFRQVFVLVSKKNRNHYLTQNLSNAPTKQTYLTNNRDLFRCERHNYSTHFLFRLPIYSISSLARSVPSFSQNDDHALLAELRLWTMSHIIKHFQNNLTLVSTETKMQVFNKRCLPWNPYQNPPLNPNPAP